MRTTRREFIERAGAGAAIGLLGACAPKHTSVGDGLIAGPDGLSCSTLHTFENWSHTIRFKPNRFCKPRTEQQVIDLVKQALAAGTHVRTQGAGHSFSQLLVTNDTLVSLDDMQSQVVVNGRRATLPGGMRLKDAIKVLRGHGLAFKNLGSVTEQSVAGAFSTGTHGTGLGIGAISTGVVGVRLVTGNGDVHTITEADAQDLSAARINLGALGVITEVTLECIPDHQLDYAAYLTTFDQAVGDIDRLNAENERVVLWWFLPAIGPRDLVVLITKNPVGGARGLLAGSEGSGTGVARERLAQDRRALGSLADRSPGPGYTKIRGVVENYDEALQIPLLPVFHRECEYAIPVGKTAEALKAMRDVIEEGDVAYDLPVEVRFVAKDDILISPCNGRDVAYIGASTLANSTEAFERFEPLMKALGGKPHWGKNFTLTREEVAGLYPGGYEAFRSVRDRFDPKRVFANSMLSEYFP